MNRAACNFPELPAAAVAARRLGNVSVEAGRALGVAARPAIALQFRGSPSREVTHGRAVVSHAARPCNEEARA